MNKIFKKTFHSSALWRYGASSSASVALWTLLNVYDFLNQPSFLTQGCHGCSLSFQRVSHRSSLDGGLEFGLIQPSTMFIFVLPHPHPLLFEQVCCNAAKHCSRVFSELVSEDLSLSSDLDTQLATSSSLRCKKRKLLRGDIDH